MESLQHWAAPTRNARAGRLGGATRWAALFLCFTLIFVVFGLYDALSRPVGMAGGGVSPTTAATTNIVIGQGATASDVARQLREKGLDVSARLFRLVSRLSGADHRIHAGEYRVAPSMSTLDLLDLFRRGKVVEYRVTIPEGFTAAEIAERLENLGLVGRQAFLEVVDKPGLAFPNGLPESLKGINTLEGFLFPDTYLFTRGATAADIARVMVHRFLEVALPLYQKSPLSGSYTLAQLVTLASVVEGEAALDRERPVIAAVFLNRLKRGMLLESCATVEYALGEHKDVLTLADIAIDSPYNTYKNPGLPPAPIGNPGLSSLRAAMYPARSVPYLFFVAKRDGSHVFSVTFAEHQKAQRAIATAGQKPGR